MTTASTAVSSMVKTRMPIPFSRFMKYPFLSPSDCRTVPFRSLYSKTEMSWIHDTSVIRSSDFSALPAFPLSQCLFQLDIHAELIQNLRHIRFQGLRCH